MVPTRRQRANFIEQVALPFRKTIRDFAILRINEREPFIACHQGHAQSGSKRELLYARLPAIGLRYGGVANQDRFAAFHHSLGDPAADCFFRPG